jgi:hypothetical protein
MMPPVVYQTLKSYAVSALFGLQSLILGMFVVGWGMGLCNTPLDALHFFASNWWAGLVGLIFGVGPYYRAHQAVVKELNGQNTPSS